MKIYTVTEGNAQIDSKKIKSNTDFNKIFETDYNPSEIKTFEDLVDAQIYFDSIELSEPDFDLYNHVFDVEFKGIYGEDVDENGESLSGLIDSIDMQCGCFDSDMTYKDYRSNVLICYKGESYSIVTNNDAEEECINDFIDEIKRAFSLSSDYSIVELEDIIREIAEKCTSNCHVDFNFDE